MVKWSVGPGFKASFFMRTGLKQNLVTRYHTWLTRFELVGHLVTLLRSLLCRSGKDFFITTWKYQTSKIHLFFYQLPTKKTLRSQRGSNPARSLIILLCNSLSGSYCMQVCKLLHSCLRWKKYNCNQVFDMDLFSWCKEVESSVVFWHVAKICSARKPFLAPITLQSNLERSHSLL